jgi:predicted transcriptional regulator
MDESEKRIAPFGLRIPPDLKERVSEAANIMNQSMNALIVSVLEKEFPHPTIEFGSLAMLLTGMVEDAEKPGGGDYIDAVNEGLANTRTPWTVEYSDGRLIFYPYTIRRDIDRRLDRSE